ncbi:hypothetical protein C5O80_03375 [Burkholderia sp. SRS-46]|nr:hypothetical protein C5O80_03375 [Burkholderia sp. SRS-46]
MIMPMLLIAAGFSVIGIGALVVFASHVDPLSGRWTGRARKRCFAVRPTDTRRHAARDAPRAVAQPIDCQRAGR